MADSHDAIEDILLSKGIISSEELDEARQTQEREGGAFVDVLVSMGLIDRDIAAGLLARGTDTPMVDLSDYQINSGAVATVSEDVARRYKVLPIDFEGDRLVVAMADLSNIFALDDLRILTGYEIRPVLTTEAELQAAIGRYFKIGESIEREMSEVDLEGGEDLRHLQEITEEAPIVKLVNLIITRAIRDRASDIHIEPQEKDLRVRYRIDGVLHEVMKSPKSIQPAILSRFKIMANMDVAERRKPQDGHAGLTVSGKAVDFRVSTLPTVYGERVVLRILEKESIMLRLDDLGFLEESLEKFQSAFRRPYGAILITGPTGSGKSTTLYATLNVLNTDAKNIVTIEDPVEYRLPGINQVQINAKAGLSFSRGLRSILRASPDIVMVGEIRDRETAQIGIEAALTGHLVFSTLHTNDAPGALTRLTEMGIQPFLTASALECVQAQRLARRLCKECKEAYEAPLEGLKEAGFPLEGKKAPTLFRPKGCNKCNNTGYKGRVGLYEVMLVSEAVERLAIEEATAEEIKRQAISEGMRTLWDDGMEKVKLGLTSIEEVMRVVA